MKKIVNFSGLPVLILLSLAGIAGCGDHGDPEDNTFDRWDACERRVSLCEQDREDIFPCLDWVEQNYPEGPARDELLQCIAAAPDCDSLTLDCLPEG